MGTNPLVSQGTLNRLRGSVVWDDFSSLNITAPYLGDEGIGLSLDGGATTFIPTLTGAVTSQEPYQSVTITVHLLKTQTLADQYKVQQELDSRLGNCTVRSDAKELSPYALKNCAIESVREMRFNGRDAGYVVTVKGYYPVNSSLWDL